MSNLNIIARDENLNLVLDFIESELNMIKCSSKIKIQILIAVEEIFINIAHYAYHPDVGETTISCEILQNPVRVMIQFSDCGKQYNPLLKHDPDISKSAEQREIGGLGIYIAKKSMDNVDYKYENGKNILTIDKKCNQSI